MESNAILESRAAEAADSPGPSIDLSRRRRIGETIIEASLVITGIISIFTTIGIVYVLLKEALGFFGSPEVSYSSTTVSPTLLM